MTLAAILQPRTSVSPNRPGDALAPLPAGAGGDRITQRLAAGTIVLLRDSESERSYAMSLAHNIEAFTLERLESLASGPAVLVLTPSLIRRWGLRHDQSVDAVSGIGVGGSTADRARTMRVAASLAPSSMLTSPGHVTIYGELDAVTGLGLRLARMSTENGDEALALSPIRAGDGTYLMPDLVAQDARLAHLPLALTS
jgi:hypothetical protein